MAKKQKAKETYRLGEQVLEDKLALEATMDDAHETELQNREDTVGDDLGSKAWARELEEYKHLSKEKAKADKEKAKRLKQK